MRSFLLIPHLKIHNANAMSSPYSIGFPAMTAWLGAVHALQRQLHKQGCDVDLTGVAVSCHHFNLQTYKGERDFVHSIIGTANPLNEKGERPAFIEEARCHLEVSLLVEIENSSKKKRDQLLACVDGFIAIMKFAGGDVLSFSKPEILSFDEDESELKALRPILNKLMLGHVLVERRSLVIQAMRDGENALDALLGYLKVSHRSTLDKNNHAIWSAQRKAQGWLVPISVGFQGISELGLAKNQRDEHTLHRFAESIVTLGEFVMPYRIECLDQLLWRYHSDLENSLYVCQNEVQL